jgi:hypothetical protein
MTDKSLFEAHRHAEIKDRLAKLSPQSTREWGVMEPAQMMAHCTKALEGACAGGWTVPRIFLGRLLGGVAKRSLITRGDPMRKGALTPKQSEVTTPCDFDREHARLSEKIDAFAAAGEDGVTREPHFFFGNLTPREWSVLQYQHLDHHLRQFGV